MKRLHLIIAALACLAISGISCWFDHTQAEKQKQKIGSFSTDIPLGATRDFVDRECQRALAAHADWTYHPTLDPSDNSIARLDSPVTDGAGNWVVYILFDDDDAVAAVLVRTLDRKTEHPAKAPPDRLASPQHILLKEFGVAK